MSTGWNYSDLSKLAKQYDGPEKLIKAIKKSSVQKGIKQGIEQGIKIGKGKMIPVVVLGIAGGAVAGGIAVYYVVSKKFSDEKKDTQISEEEAAAAEAILIEEIKKAETEANKKELESETK